MVPSSFPPRMRILVDGAGDIRFIGYEPSSPWGIIPFGLCSHRRFRPISECHPVVVPNQTRSVQHLFTIVQYGEVRAEWSLGSHNHNYEIRELGVREGPCGCRTWKYTHFAARPGSMEVNGEVNGR